MNNNQILYVPGLDISKDTGSGINERNFVTSLLNKNVNVLIPKPVNKHIISDIEQNKRLKITSWQFNKRNPFSYLYHIYGQINDIKEIVREQNIEVVVFRLGLVPIDMVYVKKKLKKKVILKHLTYLSSSQKVSLPLKIVGKVRSYFVNGNIIDACDTPSLMTKQHVEKYYGVQNIHVAKNGTSIIDSITEDYKKDKDFIYIGRLSKSRNTPDLLKAFAKSNKTIDIYGFGELENLTKEYADRYDNINFYGKVPYEELSKILINYKFGVDLTFVNTEFGKASYSQKIAQYLSYGLNTLAIDCPDNEFIKENNCGVLFNNDKNNLLNLINKMEYKAFNPSAFGKHIFADVIVDELIQFWKQ